MGNQIFCTDCHNSDDNREFGGTGPNGPHGSTYTHILERRLRIQPGRGAGQTDHQSLPQSRSQHSRALRMCGKCHDLTNVVSKHQLEPARPAHQRRLHLLGMPHRSWHGRQERDHLRRAAGEFRRQCSGAEWWHSRLLQPRHEYLRAGLPRRRPQCRRLRDPRSAAEE